MDENTTNIVLTTIYVIIQIALMVGMGIIIYKAIKSLKK